MNNEISKNERIKLLYSQLASKEEQIGILDIKKLELMFQVSEILDELAELGEKVDI